MLDHTLHNMFFLDPTTVTVLEKILRPICVYVSLIVGLRLAGKRELAQMNPFDLIVLLTLSNTVQNAIIGNDNSVSGGLIGAATLMSVNYLVVRLVYRYRKLGRIIEGRPDVLMREGRILKDHLERELISKEELLSAARKQGIMSLHEVESCMLEPNGTLTFVAKKPSPDSERHDAIMAHLQAISEHLKVARAATGQAAS